MNVSAPVDVMPEVEQRCSVSSSPNSDATGCLSVPFLGFFSFFLFFFSLFCCFVLHAWVYRARTLNNETSTRQHAVFH